MEVLSVMTNKSNTSPRPTLHASSIGFLAEGIVADCRELKATAVFRRSFYAENALGQLMCFVRDDAEPGPLNILCAGWPDDMTDIIAPCDVLNRRGAAHFFTADLSVSLATGTVWRPPPPPFFDPPLARAGVRRLRDLLPAMTPPDSLARLTFAAASSIPEKETVRRHLFMMAEPPLIDLAAWLAAPSALPLPDSAPSLIGLGLGLTPSGDDALGGIALALHALKNGIAVEKLAMTVNETGEERTNRISRAHLNAAMIGAGVAALHDCVDALLTGGKDLPSVLQRLSRVGHSSGWDALLGIFLAFGGACGIPCLHQNADNRA